MAAGVPRILFYADAGLSVGGGHVMRCLTLAQALRERGAVCGFIATPEAVSVLDRFADEGIERVGIGAADAEAIDAAARGWNAGAMVVDHYRFDQEKPLRAAGRPLMVIDDLRRAHECELVLDSNLGRTAADYPGSASLTGVQFTLVRHAFAERRAEALGRRARTLAPHRLLVSLGLTDFGGVTARVVESLAPELGERAMDVVIGSAAPSRATLEALAARDPRIALHIDAQDMPALTAAADLAVGAGGSSSWERCCLGLPTVTVILADNQRANAHALKAAGASLALEASAGDFEAQLRAEVRRMIDDEALRLALTEASARLCDGKGAARVADRLLSLAN